MKKPKITVKAVDMGEEVSATPIFIITTLHPEKGRFRTVGWFPTLEEAQKVLEKNWGSLNEAGWYPYAVIEAIAPGLYPTSDKAPEGQQYGWWYEYFFDDEGDDGKEGWVAIEERPELADNDDTSSPFIFCLGMAYSSNECFAIQIDPDEQ